MKSFSIFFEWIVVQVSVLEKEVLPDGSSMGQTKVIVGQNRQIPNTALSISFFYINFAEQYKITNRNNTNTIKKLLTNNDRQQERWNTQR